VEIFPIVAFRKRKIDSAKTQGSQSSKQKKGMLPPHVKQDLEIQQLCDLYQQQLTELNACHTLLQKDQKRLSEMLRPWGMNGYWYDFRFDFSDIIINMSFW
jgi:hypothetical protein